MSWPIFYEPNLVQDGNDRLGGCCGSEFIRENDSEDQTNASNVLAPSRMNSLPQDDSPAKCLRRDSSAPCRRDGSHIIRTPDIPFLEFTRCQDSSFANNFLVSRCRF
jgi:hypothetical protein